MNTEQNDTNIIISRYFDGNLSSKITCRRRLGSDCTNFVANLRVVFPILQFKPVLDTPYWKYSCKSYAFYLLFLISLREREDKYTVTIFCVNFLKNLIFSCFLTYCMFVFSCYFLKIKKKSTKNPFQNFLLAFLVQNKMLLLS